jgi:hypothetical protein
VATYRDFSVLHFVVESSDRQTPFGVSDHRVRSPKPTMLPECVQDYAALPEELILREVNIREKILAITFLAPRSIYPDQFRLSARRYLPNERPTVSTDSWNRDRS